uniref:RNA-dependent RNA polymerase n=1 Tax=Messner virus TaxID=2707243 RepID=A0A6H0DIQ9_9VIRU|nr:MAG: RNA-dependent RNA polymerase [Messner virus]
MYAICLLCLNLMSSWKDPSDLSDQTWKHLIEMTQDKNVIVDLIVIDAEIRTVEETEHIEDNVAFFVPKLLSSTGVLIYKVFGTHLLVSEGKVISKVGSLFKQTELKTTQVTSSFSSEMYLVCQFPLQSKIRDPYVNMEQVRQALNKCYALRSIQEGFERACSIQPSKMMSGIPTNLIPSSAVEASIILMDLGMGAGNSHECAQLIAVNQGRSNDALPVVLSVLAVHSNSILNITKETNPEIYAPPSDQRLQKHLTFFLGSWIFLAWLTKRLTYYTRVQLFLRDTVTYN